MPQSLSARLQPIENHLPGDSTRQVYWMPGHPIVGDADTLVKVYDARKQILGVNNPGAEKVLERLEIQNLCAFPVKFCINDAVAADNYHGILAACSAAGDGLGSIRTLFPRREDIRFVTVMAVGGVLAGRAIKVVAADLAKGE